MNDSGTDGKQALEQALPGERELLVRLCYRLSGSADAAEDLAQETLLEAWKHANRLVDTADSQDARGYRPWLSAIARNVCLHWTRSQYRVRAHLASGGHGEQGAANDAVQALPDVFDLEAELEQTELASLLDRALALLPPVTRAVLIRHYIEGIRHTEIAAQLGLSPGAVLVRLHRGRVALRRVLASELRLESRSYGAGQDAGPAWEDTRIWCPSCGQRRLMGRFDPIAPELVLRCSDCYAGMGAVCAQSVWPAALKGARGYKSALSRLQRMASAQYWRALAGEAVSCDACGGSARVHLGMPDSLPAFMRERPGAYIACHFCGSVTNMSLDGLVLALPEGRRFWRDYPRLRILPQREIEEVDGRPALVTRLTAVSSPAGLDVIVSRDNFRVLKIDRFPQASQA